LAFPVTCVISLNYLLVSDIFLIFFFSLTHPFGNGVVDFPNETKHLTKASGSAVNFFALRRSVTLDVELKLNR
jgi:hypothetical protein